MLAESATVVVPVVMAIVYRIIANDEFVLGWWRGHIS